MDRVVGVMKAYTTRVGEGPLPTENSEIADLLHSMGREFGATTGRARRCGWFDAVATRHATMVNGIDELAVTNVDGLDTLEVIRVCVSYRVGRETLSYVPSNAELLAGANRCMSISGLENFDRQIRRWKDLPQALPLRSYLQGTIARSSPGRNSPSFGCPARRTEPIGCQ
jgi:adenylosuccinate synthase